MIESENKILEESGKWKVVMMGAGCSTSVPKIECFLAMKTDCVCSSAVPLSKNNRLNPCIVLQKVSTNGEHKVLHNVLVDVCKTFRETVLRHFCKFHIKTLDSIIITHGHCDAIGGLDDIRELQERGKTTNIWMDAMTKDTVVQMFPYLFPSEENSLQLANLFVAKLNHILIQNFQDFQVHDLLVSPIPMHHGKVTSLGFIFTNHHLEKQFVYFSDFRCKSIYRFQPTPENKEANPELELNPQNIEELTFLVDREKSLELLKRKPISVMILDCLTLKGKYISHSNFHETTEIIRIFNEVYGIKPDKIYLTGQGCDMDYSKVNEILKEKFPNQFIECGYDGLDFDI